MAVLSQVIRNILVRARKEGVDETAASMRKLADAEGKVAAEQQNVGKSSVSMQNRLNSLQRTVDVQFRAQQNMDKATRTLSQARAQGLISMAEEAALLEKSRGKWLQNTEEVLKNEKAMGLNRMQMMELTHVARSMFDQIAAGQSPLRALTLEGTRIGQVFSMGTGGVGATLIALAPAAAAAAVAVGGAALAVGGLTRTLDRDTGKQITMMETLKAVGQALWSDITRGAKPAINQLGQWFQQFVDWITPTFKEVGNEIIAAFVAPYDYIISVWKHLPDALGGLAKMAVNNLVADLDKPLLTFNGKTLIPGLPTGFGQLSLTKSEQAAVSGASGSFGNAMSRDYMGEFYGQVKGFALKDFAADQAGTAKAVKAANDNLKEQKSAIEALQKAYDDAKSTFQGFFSGIVDNLKQGQNVFQAFGNAVLDVLGKIGSKLMDMATGSLFDSLFSGLSVGGGTSFWGSIFKGIGFANGGVFGPMGQITPFATGGIVTRPTVFPFATGVGLMGEAGPEAIMPLRRGPDGRLGVAAPANANAAPTVHVTIGNITGSKQDAAEIAMQVSQTLRRQLPDAIAAYNHNPHRRHG